MDLNSNKPSRPFRTIDREYPQVRNDSTEENVSITNSNGPMDQDETVAITIAAALLHPHVLGKFDSHPVSAEQVETAKNRFLRHMRAGGYESDRGWRHFREDTDPLMPHGPDDPDDLDGQGEPVGGTQAGGSSR